MATRCNILDSCMIMTVGHKVSARKNSYFTDHGSKKSLIVFQNDKKKLFNGIPSNLGLTFSPVNEFLTSYRHKGLRNPPIY